jgi:hypothetical protein
MMEMRQAVRRATISTGALAILLTGGCAAIVGGMNQPVSVDARTPDGQTIAGANCTLQNAKGVWYVTTPGTLMVHRAYGDLSISCNKSGRPLGASVATSSVRGWMFGNLLFGGVIGIGVDIGTGAGYDYPTLISVPVSGSVGVASFAYPTDTRRASERATGSDSESETAREESELPAVQRDVSSGIETLVAAHADWDKICMVDGPAPTITLLDPSQHGQVQIKQGEFVAPDTGAPAACASGKIYGTQVFYASKAGFHGTDHIRYEVVADSGRFTRVVDISVK